MTHLVTSLFGAPDMGGIGLWLFLSVASVAMFVVFIPLITYLGSRQKEEAEAPEIGVRVGLAHVMEKVRPCPHSPRKLRRRIGRPVGRRRVYHHQEKVLVLRKLAVQVGRRPLPGKGGIDQFAGVAVDADVAHGVHGRREGEKQDNGRERGRVPPAELNRSEEDRVHDTSAAERRGCRAAPRRQMASGRPRPCVGVDASTYLAQRTLLRIIANHGVMAPDSCIWANCSWSTQRSAETSARSGLIEVSSASLA